MTEDARVRQALVQFPLAGDRDRGLGVVRVIDWGRPGLSSRMTVCGPNAHAMGTDKEIEATIRTERLCGGCYPSGEDGQLMVELELGECQQVSGASYTLALVLADKIVRGCLPLFAGCTVVASGHVRRDGSIGAVGRLAEKLAVVERALARQEIAIPLLVLPQANLDAMTVDERTLLNSAIALGVRCEGVTKLADMDATWPREPTVGPDRSSPRPRTLKLRAAFLLALGALAVLVVVALYQVQEWRTPDNCGQLSADADTVARCWGPLPLTLEAECRVERQGGYHPWRPCASGTCLDGLDQFRLVLHPDADGWLYAFHLDVADGVLEDLWPEQVPRRVRAGETVRLPPSGRTYHIDGRSVEERFFCLLTRGLLPESAGPSAANAILADLLNARAEQFAICHDPLSSGRSYDRSHRSPDAVTSQISGY